MCFRVFTCVCVVRLVLRCVRLRRAYMQNTEEGKMRRFKIPEPWGDVVELLVVCEENSDGGGLVEYQMQQSEIPLRFFECSIDVQETKKEVQARGNVTLKFVPGPGEDSKKLSRIIEESFRSHLHALEESFLS